MQTLFPLYSCRMVAFQASVRAATPAILAADSSGVGQGAILNSDLSVNSPPHPAKRGSTVAIYATRTGTLQLAVRA